MGHEVPEFPTIFAKFADALIGPFDDLVLPKHAGEKVDWETELAIVIGKKASMVSESEAENFIAGYAIMNDVTMRDYQNRTAQWLQGKTFANSAPFGPYLVTADSFQFGGEISTQVSGKTVQSSTLNDQVFNPAELIAYISQILPLNPGDVIITGTPSGVGHGQKPPTYLASGQVLTSYIEGIGSLENHVV
jgi:acylpyruvate hydrolase